jgi:hypothetical protein
MNKAANRLQAKSHCSMRIHHHNEYINGMAAFWTPLMNNAMSRPNCSRSTNRPIAKGIASRQTGRTWVGSAARTDAVLGGYYPARYFDYRPNIRWPLRHIAIDWKQALSEDQGSMPV